MALLNAVQFLATSNGTADFVVSAAANGFLTPNAGGAANGTTYTYRSENASLTEWEVGKGAWINASSTVQRTTIIASSAGSLAKTNFTLPPVVGFTATVDDFVPGSNTQMFFNDSGQSNAAAGVTYNKATNTLSLSGALAVTGTGSIGAAGTGATQAILFLEGGSAAAGGGYISFRKNSVAKSYIGSFSAINGAGTSDDFAVYNAGFGFSVTISNITGVVSILNSTASSSTTTGALTVAGGLGVAGAINIGSTLAVTGASILTGAVSIGGNAYAGEKLQVVSNASALTSLGFYQSTVGQWSIGMSSGSSTWRLTWGNPVGVGTDVITAVAGGITIPGTLAVTGAISVGGLTTLFRSGGYTTLYDNGGSNISILLGASDPSNYYRNSYHYFQGISGSGTTAVSVTGTISVTGVINVYNSSSTAATSQALAGTQMGYSAGYQALRVGGPNTKVIALHIDPNTITGSSFNGNATEIALPSPAIFLQPNAGATNWVQAITMVNGVINVPNTTASSSTTTGALTVAGGLGVVGDIIWGGASMLGYTPTIGSGSGSAPGGYSASGYYKKFGKFVFFTVTVNISTVGSATGYIHFSTPSTVNFWGGGCGDEENVNGHMVNLRYIGANNVNIVYYDNSATSVVGQYVVQGWYSE